MPELSQLGGSDDYSTAGYGELPPKNGSANGPLWTNTDFTGSGKTNVTILGGRVGPDIENLPEGTALANADGIPYGSVFGGSRGTGAEESDNSPRYKYVPDYFLGYVNKTAINIGGYINNDETTTLATTSPTIYGSVYGGGQDGHVRNSTEVRIFKGSVAGQGTYDTAGRSGNVFGAGSGIGKYTTNSGSYCNKFSGSVSCTTLVEVSDGTIAGNVYGGGALASVGPPKITQDKYEQKTASEGHASHSLNRVNIKGGTITGSVYGASRGPADSFRTTAFPGGVSTAEGTAANVYNPTMFATSLWTEVNVTGGTIGNSVYGGGEMGQVKESTVVNLTGGDIAHDAFGGGKGTDLIAADIGGNTTVELNKGLTNSSVGCSVQRIFGCNDFKGTPKGHPLVHVYATRHKNQSTIGSKYKKFDKLSNYTIENYSSHTYEEKTLAGLASDVNINTTIAPYKDYTDILGSTSATEKAKKEALENLIGTIADKKYDVLAVYGGGNLAKYDPTDAYSADPLVKKAARTEVIIEGCNLTSIKQVYGGGNAAPVPATTLDINSAYEIHEAFGGGNGKDNYSVKEGTPATDVWYENPGANVGYDNYTHYHEDTDDPAGTNYGSGSLANPYRAIENRDATNKEYRQAYYMYGQGEAKTEVLGGRIHRVYGGSNEKGNISTLALSVYETSTDCPVVVDESTAAGKNADIDGTAEMSMNCIDYSAVTYGASEAADVNSDVVLNITNGHFGKIFGGNNKSGRIRGSITINIQESSCRPIVIDELYGGGYLAGYSIYGYYDTGNKDADNKPIYAIRDKAKFEADTTEVLKNVDKTNETAVKNALIEAGLWGYPKNNPRINVISATKIGTIYGGGYEALVVGSPYINVNMQNGVIPKEHVVTPPTGMNYGVGPHTKVATETEPAYTYKVKEHDTKGNAILEIGSIGSIYGGGNLADVNGNTNVEIGTGRWISTWDASGNPVWESTNADGDVFTYKEVSAAVTYTQEECNEYNVTLTGALHSTDELTAEDAAAYNAKLTGAIASGTKLSAEQATAVNTALGLTGEAAYATDGTAVLSAADAASYNATLTGAVATGGPLTADQANAYNATLTGARNTNDIKTQAEWQWYDASGEVTTAPSSSGRNAATITGNVFGGGKGETHDSGDGAFKCATAMIGADGDGLIDSNGGTTVTIGNGSVGGNVYGGGEIGRVEKNTVVTIGLKGNTTNELTIGGSVFGAGKGVATHGYSALVRGNSTVTIQGKAKVLGSVYGGGEIASVGRYNVNPSTGLPESLANEKSGNCTVIVQDDAEIGRDDMKMEKYDASNNPLAPDNTGHVFGAGQGATPYIDKDGNAWANPYRIKPDNSKQTFDSNTETAYLGYLESLGLATQTNVIITGNAFVKGDVFGGAENGFVQHDTHVTIEGNCQIGNGYAQMDENGTYLDELETPVTPIAMNRRYTAKEWEKGYLFVEGDTEVDATEASEAALRTAVGSNYKHSLPECASWKYKSPFAVYDKYANESGYDSKNGAVTASDGHTFFGNVFGGGSGYFPYAKGLWHFKAGNVGGNTLVEIKGGHILTNVYGGNEMTNVEGSCTVTMSGGTIGVPRTFGQIIAHPVSCHLYGAGMGDPRVFFNKQTNVKDAIVSVTGGTIYGTVFGGGEDGHVLRDVTMTIGELKTTGEGNEAVTTSSGPTIGTWGTSYVEGNVFGGGRGFRGDAYTAGNVAGCVTMTINGGTILGSVYGGGRLASVGYGLFAESETTGYGKMRADTDTEEGFSTTGFFTKGRGHIDITIKGGTIGNDIEYVIPSAADNTAAGISESDVAKWTDSDWTKWKNYKHIPYTEFVYDDALKLYRLSHTKGGNVYAGGMGRMYQLNGTTPITAVDWWKMGNVKSTKLTINKGATIKGNLYGGCELGMVQGTHTSADSKTVSTEIIINGGTVGTEIHGAVEVPAEQDSEPATTEDAIRYTFGSVFGGGYGSITEKLTHTPTSGSAYDTYPKYIAGRVKGSTEVTMTDGAVKASIYGGGEMAAVGESKVISEDEQVVRGETLTGTGGKAMDGNTYVTVSGGTIGIPKTTITTGKGLNIYYGGATMGNVYGGGSGYINTVRSGQIYGNTNVTISQAEGKTTNIYHNIYGGGAYGTVGDFTYVTTTEGGNKKVTNIGELHTDRKGTGTATITITGGEIGTDGHENGMIFGSSRGEVDEPGKRPDYLAWVNKTNVTIGTAPSAPGEEGSGEEGTGEESTGVTNDTPLIKGSVYGSGENGHTYENAVVNIHSGTIGNVSEYYKYRGNVYGGGCGTDTYTVTKDGKKFEYYNPWAGIVRKSTEINIDGGVITGCVYGAGAMAMVGTITNVADTAGVAKHDNEESSFALSWPYKFEFKSGTGKATINITGGHIGIKGTDGGDVYGSARGEAGNRYATAHFAYVKDTEVNISYPTPTSLSDLDDISKGCITGSVHGSGEDGYVYGDTHVTLNNGLIGHSLYGGGKGKGTYKVTLNKIGSTTETYEADIYSLIAGKVMGNTYVTMNDGIVGRNVYGGGNMASVGKGNYASGADDYFPDGYGETLNNATEDNDKILWDASKNDNSLAFMNSGITTVKVFGGQVGTISKTLKNNLPYGNVFGGSAGESAPFVPNLTDLYKYCPAYYSGYVNETDVTIGGYKCNTAYGDYNVGDCITDVQYNALASGKDNWEKVGPTIVASVYGGAQDGHVRRDTKVTVNSGTIGLDFKDNKGTLETDDPNHDQWLARGNVYGGGSGISEYTSTLKYKDKTPEADMVPTTGYSNTAGSVSRFTEVNILGGTIHRNVYGGG